MDHFDQIVAHGRVQLHKQWDLEVILQVFSYWKLRLNRNLEVESVFDELVTNGSSFHYIQWFQDVRWTNSGQLENLGSSDGPGAE